MSTIDEQHVRQRLQDTLESIEVPMPPAQAITGRGGACGGSAGPAGRRPWPSWSRWACRCRS